MDAHPGRPRAGELSRSGRNDGAHAPGATTARTDSHFSFTERSDRSVTASERTGLRSSPAERTEPNCGAVASTPAVASGRSRLRTLAQRRRTLELAHW